MSPVLIILNYLVRGFIIAVGLYFTFANILPPNQDAILVRTMGVVFILFGIYRIVTFYSSQKEYARREREE